MSSTPYISVVMPAYNAETTIRESIESVIGQTYRNWELIVVDDCSSDNTEKIVREYDRKIITVRKEKNEGVAEARNTGVERASYDWIAFLDSDDIWTSDKLEKIVKLINRIPEGKFFFTGSGFIDNEGKSYDFVLKVPERICYSKLLYQNVISCSSVVIKKELMQKNRMPGGFMHEDFATWLSILKTEKYAYGLCEPLLIYRMSAKSKSGNKAKAAVMNWNTYRYVGLPFIKRLLCMAVYTYRNLKKYRNLASKTCKA